MVLTLYVNGKEKDKNTHQPITAGAPPLMVNQVRVH